MPASTSSAATVASATMRAAVFHGPEEITVEQRPVPQPGAGELVLRVAATTLCGTDRRIFQGVKTRHVRSGGVLGHEFVGVVAAVGEGVDQYTSGQAVGVCPVVSCGSCRACRRGLENVCEARQGFGYQYDGSLAEYVLIPARAVARGNVVPLPSGLSFDALRPFAIAEPLACCLNGHRQSPVALGDAVVVVGGGPIGLLHVQLARRSGAGLVVLVEPTEDRAAIGIQLGADEAVADLDRAQEVLDRHEAADGADVVLVCVGLPDLLPQTVQLARKGGMVNLFAGFPSQGSASLDPNVVHYDQVQLVGSSAMTREDYHRAVRLIAGNQIDVERLITAIMPLTEAGDAIRAIGRPDQLKIVVESAPAD